MKKTPLARSKTDRSMGLVLLGWALLLPYVCCCLMCTSPAVALLLNVHHQRARARDRHTKRELAIGSMDRQHNNPARPSNALEQLFCCVRVQGGRKGRAVCCDHVGCYHCTKREHNGGGEGDERPSCRRQPRSIIAAPRRASALAVPHLPTPSPNAPMHSTRQTHNRGRTAAGNAIHQRPSEAPSNAPTSQRVQGGSSGVRISYRREGCGSTASPRGPAGGGAQSGPLSPAPLPFSSYVV